MNMLQWTVLGEVGTSFVRLRVGEIKGSLRS
jgi:hypothetical protein